MSLGLKRGTVKLVPHNPRWKKLFKEEKKLLMDTFGDTIIAIEHIGSTAIPDLVAKPILDMNIGVKSLKIAKAMKPQFEQLGYEHRPFKPGHTKEGLIEQKLYVKGPKLKRTHHAHVTVFESEYWNKDLLFRDYLRANKDVADEYAKLKQELAVTHMDDRYTYTDKKVALIEDILKRAKQWKEKII